MATGGTGKVAHRREGQRNRLVHLYKRIRRLQRRASRGEGNGEKRTEELHDTRGVNSEHLVLVSEMPREGGDAVAAHVFYTNRLDRSSVKISYKIDSPLGLLWISSVTISGTGASLAALLLERLRFMSSKVGFMSHTLGKDNEGRPST